MKEGTKSTAAADNRAEYITTINGDTDAVNQRIASSPPEVRRQNNAAAKGHPKETTARKRDRRLRKGPWRPVEDGTTLRMVPP